MPKLTLESAMARMPEGHYDGELTGYVLRSKSPNSHRPEGFMWDRRFFAEDFAADLAEALGDGWAVKPDDSGMRYPSESAQLMRGDARITIRCPGYGAQAYAKINLSSYCLGADHRTVSGPDISVSAAKDVATIARDVTRRLLPGLNETDLKATEAKAKAKAERDALESMLAKLQKAYPDLKFSIGDSGRGQNDKNLYVSTKYGSKIDLSATIYRSGDYWRMITGRGGDGSLSIDNIETPHGRAFLRLVND